MRLCEDCKHYTNGVLLGVTYLEPLCGAVTSLIDGSKEYAERARVGQVRDIMSEPCGKEGRFWEPKE